MTVILSYTDSYKRIHFIKHPLNWLYKGYKFSVNYASF